MGSDYFDVTVKAASEGANQPGLYRQVNIVYCLACAEYAESG